MKKKRGIKIEINISNKAVYTLIAIGILIAIGVGVYAYGTSDPSTFGHSLGEIGFPSCADGQVLKSQGGTWVCGTDESAKSLCSGEKTLNGYGNCEDLLGEFSFKFGTMYWGDEKVLQTGYYIKRYLEINPDEDFDTVSLYGEVLINGNEVL